MQILQTAILLVRAGPNEPILDWQRKRGFAGVQEKTLKALAADLAMEDVATDFASVCEHSSLGLKAALLVKLDSTLSQSDVNATLNAVVELESTEDPTASSELFD